MRSRPLPESIFIFCLFLGVGFPLWHLTGDVGQKIAPPSRLEKVSTLDSSSLEVFVEIKFAHLPEKSTLSLPDGAVLWDWQNGDGEAVSEIKMELPVRDGHILPLTLSIEWPEETPDTAVSLVFEPDGMENIEKTFWGNGYMEATISLED